MSRTFFCFLFFLFLFPSTLLALVGRDSTCDTVPYADYVKFDALAGAPQDLPEGTFFYNKKGESGLFFSPVRAFSETMIPGTSADLPRSIDISDDGQWLVYINAETEKLVLISVDGSVKTNIAHKGEHGNPVVAGFIRSSPKGMEIFYVEGDNSSLYSTSRMRAVTVNLSGGTPSTGMDRLIADLGANYGFSTYYGASYGFVKDQLFGRLFQLPKTVNGNYRSFFITIPDNGLGIADSTHIYKFKDHAKQGGAGCGHSMSWDGGICVANAGPGDGCSIPKTHKGFYMTPFRHYQDQALFMADHIEWHGVSVNWCPTNYMVNWNWRDVDFERWSFTNSNQYVVGRVEGNLAPEKGIFVVHWESNTWTLVSPRNNRTIVYDEPVLWFDNPSQTGMQRKSSVPHRHRSRTQIRGVFGAPHQSTIAIPANATRARMYSLSGSLLWAGPVSGHTVTLPPWIAASLHFIKFSNDDR